MSLRQRIVITLLALLQLSSCAIFNASRELEHLARNADLTHMHVNCDLLDLQGKLVFRISGTYCLPKENGDIYVYLSENLVRYDSRKRSYWEVPITLNRQLTASRIDESILAVQKRTVPIDKLQFVFDVLTVIDENGKTSKSFVIGDPKKVAATTGEQRSSYVIKFFEIVGATGAQNQLRGYAAADAKQNKIFIFDSQLTAVRDTVELDVMKLLDVFQSGENELIFAEENPDTYGVIVRKLNLMTKKQEVLFETKPSSTPHYAADIQRLDQDNYFIFHGLVTGVGVGGFETHSSYAELVNIATAKSTKISLQNLRWPGTAGRLVNAVDFLKRERYY